MAITQNGVLKRDDNDVPVSGGVSSVDGSTVLNAKIDPITGRWLVDNSGGGSGTVTSVSVATANGFAGTVANATTTPAITVSTTVTGITKGDGTTLSAATAGTDYTALAFKTLAVSGQSDIVADTASDTLTIAAGSNITLTTNASTDTLTIAAASAVPTTITVANEGTDTSCFPAFFTAATGDLGPKTNTNLTYNSNTGAFGITGALTATTVNGLTITANGTNTLNIAAGKSLIVSNILTLAGTDSTTMTFPTTSASIARTDAGQTFTGVSNATSWNFTTPVLGTPTSGTLTNCTGLPAASVVAGTLGSGTFTTTRLNFTNNAIAASSNAATVPITSSLNTVTNSSAATLTITMTTTSAVDGQMTIVRILDSSAAAQTVTWVNTENSTVTAPTTSNGSTTLFLTVGFIYNGGTSKWRCIASA